MLSQYVTAASLRAYLKRGYEGQQDKFEFMVEYIVKLYTRLVEVEGALAKTNSALADSTKATKQVQEKQSKMHTKQNMIIRRVEENEANALNASKQGQMGEHTNSVAKQIAEIKQAVSKRQAAKGKSRKVTKPTPVKQGKRTNKPERVPNPTAKKIVIRGVKPGMNNDAVAATINAQVKLKAMVKNLAFIRYPNTRRPVVAEFATLEALQEFVKNKSKLAEGWLFDEWKERPGSDTGRSEAAQPRGPTTVETAFIHNTPGGFQIYPKYFTAAETELAQKMGELWAKFIFDELTEDEWPHYKADTEDYLSIGDNGPSFIPKRGYRVTECEFWDTAYPEGPEIIEHDMAYFEETHANWLNEGVIILLNNGILVKSIGQKALWVILLIAVVRLLYVKSRTSPAKLKTN